jgi:hypothetical protein
MIVRSVCAWGKHVSCVQFTSGRLPSKARSNGIFDRALTKSSVENLALSLRSYGRSRLRRTSPLSPKQTSVLPLVGCRENFLLLSASSKRRCMKFSAINQSRGSTERRRRVPHLVGEDNRPWESRAINIGRLDGQESGSGHRQRSASHTASVSNGAVCGAVRGALVLLSPISAGRSGDGSITAARTTPITRCSADPERRAKALGPHSERVPVARHPRDLSLS